jgi:hypothetical protein
MTEYTKSEAAVLDYTIDWTDFLQDDELITEHEFLSEEGVTLGEPDLTGANHTVFVSGGDGGRTYRVTSRITTDQGRTQEQSFLLRITET